MFKLDAMKAQKIIDLYVEGKSQKEISDIIGVSRPNVSLILSGRTWTELIRPKDLPELLKWRRCHEYLSVQKPSLTDHQKNLITGSLLGDGWLSKCKGLYRDARFNKQHKHREHIDWLSKELSPYSLNVHIRKSTTKPIVENKKIKHVKVPLFVAGYLMYTTTDKIFTQLLEKWYPNGKKSPPNELTINPEILSIWYVDDGSNHYRSCKLCTNGFTFKEVEFLVDRLHLDLKLSGSIVKEKYLSGDKPTIYFYGENYDNFMNIVKPLMIWECFSYKTREVKYAK